MEPPVSSLRSSDDAGTLYHTAASEFASIWKTLFSSQLKTPFVIATGLAAAGQHEFALACSKPAGPFSYIEGNKLLYDALKTNWTKVSTPVYVERVTAACGSASASAPVLFESSYSSGAYPGKQDPREQAIDALIDLYSSSKRFESESRTDLPRPMLVIFRAPDLTTALKPLMARVMERARGTPDAQGVNPETPESVSIMVADFVRHFQTNWDKLIELASVAAWKGWNVIVVA
jgi:hypothetical protein